MASNSMPALSPSPASVAQASSSAHANSIMRPIQTHVRVLGYPEYFHYSRDRILTLSKLKHNGSKGKGVVDTSSIVPPTAEGTLPPSEDPLDRSNIVCEARLANLHPYGQSTERFFEAAVAPCIESALSGQSFVFLVTGPGRSGRSQTVYGDNTKTKGLVELTAERLLQMVGEGDYLSRKGAAGGASVSPSNANRAFNAAANQMSMAPTVTYSCYGCSGNNVFETVTNEPVELREFPAPLGLIPLPKMNLLEIPRHAVCIPKNKNASYFTQFQIVKPLATAGASGADGAAQTPAATPSSSAASSANARRCAQATITFVDLVQVVGVGTSAVSPDLGALMNAVSACSGGGGGAGAGADPQFGRCALTRLLEQSIVGTTTMIPIATVTGLSDFFNDTTATLKFVESFGRIHQVMSLLNIVVPSWLRSAYEDMRQTEAENDAQLTSAYQRGCYEAYASITKVLGGEEARARKESAVFDGISEKVAELRSATYKTVNEENAKVAALIAAEKEEADAAEAQVSRDSGYLRNQQFANNCEDDVRRHEALIARLRTETESVISDCKARIAHHSANASKREREEAEHEEEERALKKAIVQRVAAWGRRVEDVSAACVVDKSLKWVDEVKSDIDRLERYVTEGSMRAKNATTAERMDRELRARLLRVTQLERQVEELRLRQQAQHQQHYQMSTNQYHDPHHMAVPRGESVASSSVSMKDDARDGRSNSRRRSTTPRTSRAALYGVPPPPSSTSTTRRASAIPSTAPTSRYLQPTSASALRQSSLTGNSPSTSPGSKFTTSSTRNPAGIRPSTAHHPSSSSYAAASDRQSRSAGSSAFSPLGKALSMTTNAVVSVQSILGSKFGGGGRSSPASSSALTDARDKEKNAARGTALGSTASLQSRQSSRSSLVPSHVPTTRPNNGNSSSAYSPSRGGALSSASSMNNASPTSTLVKKPSPSAVASAAAAARRGVGMTPSKILAPLNGCDEDDDATSAHYSTTFIASP